MKIQALKAKFDGIRRANEKLYLVGIDMLSKSLIVLFAAYFIASISSSAMLMLISSSALTHPKKAKLDVQVPRVEKVTNYRDLRKAVLARNVFNQSGELPDEPDPSEGGTGNAFNPDDKCQKPSLNVDLLGIIDTGNPETSLASIQEKGYTIADIYRAGDRIIGQDQALVHAIEATQVILNNNGVKECLDLNSLRVAKPVAIGASGGSGNTGSKPPVATPPPEGEGEQGADCPSSTVSMEAAFVEESLGPGFSKILEVGRLVPFHRDNAMVGFKLIGVRSGSIWSRMNLGSGDVITAVNGISMAQPEKGFAVYEALQGEKQIRVETLKAGKSPCSLNVEIK